MKRKLKNNGSIMLIAIFVISLLSTLVIGLLQVNTEEIQLMQNQVYMVKADTIAQAGLNDAFATLRSNRTWKTGFNKSFLDGSYAVDVTGTLPFLTIESTGYISQGYEHKIAADITITEDSPYIIRIDSLRVNE